MTMFPRPPLPSFQVTLLPEPPPVRQQQAPGKAHSASSPPSPSCSSRASIQMQDEAAAKAMLHAVLDMAYDCTMPQRRFCSYSPEAVLRSVRALVDSDLCAPLVESLQAAARAYAQRCVEVLMAQQQQLPPGAGTPEGMANDATESDEEATALSANATLGVVQILAQLVTYWERLQQGLAELSSVWVYADQWCSMQVGSAMPRSLIAAATQEIREVFSGYPELCDTALAGYVAVLKAELTADTAALLSASRSARMSYAAALPDKRAAASLADSEQSVASAPPLPSADATPLAALACPPSLASLDKPLRQRLLRLFTQLTLATQQYTTRVEPTVVRVVRGHYEEVAHRLWAENVNARVFFRFCDFVLRHVGPMSASLLHPGTSLMLEEAIQGSLISTVGSEVLKRDFVALMERQEYRSLRLAWRLLSVSARVRSSPLVADLFHEYLMDCGQRIMEELVPSSTKGTPAAALVPPCERPFLAVRHLLGLLEQGSRTVAKCFSECERDFKVALHEDLQTILEAYPQAFSEQLAAYQDAIMREVEVGHVPVGSSKPTPPVALEKNGDDDNDDEEDVSSSPLRRPRPEGTSPSSRPPVAAPSPDLTRAEEDEGASSGREEPTEVEDAAEGDAVMGAAALHHAAPLPTGVREATSVLRRIAHIYSYHPKKDLFEAAYWRDFARRCLHAHRKLNSTAENTFIGFLRDICGLSFTSKFEGMLTDLTSSTELTTQYNTWVQEQERSLQQQQQQPSGEEGAETSAVGRLVPEAKSLDAHLFILTQSYWPECPSMPSNFYVPPAVRAITQLVEKFYTGRFPNRHLSWQHPLSHATLVVRLTPQSSTLTLTGTYTQCVLLMQLDALYDRGVTSITAKALCDAVGMDIANTELLGSLQGLCHPRFRLVLRAEAASSPPSGDGAQRTSAELDNEDDESAARVEEAAASCASPQSSSPGTAAGASAGCTLAATDLLQLNLGFTSATSKVRIPFQTRMRTTASAGLDGPSRGGRTADNGGHLVEVAIVSCLKAQRTMTRIDLASAVAARVPFPVTTAVLKKAIDKMIERGFMVRGKDNAYVYSA
ncbi:cullin-like protein [Leishmania donovani]|uniref:Cullin_family/Cullin_protein_neddylation_domain_c ontaining_protein_putative/Pfam:PF00888/Pfam:PF10557 n=1 Tax=Leishmania donovani TaxID=5661 RepID=A0A6J8FCQ7_LEIDO|nr:cullin-like protein [Leishmania donovani]VDZ45322.1 Cullin_family/Cullin_protein_neddylation_domain_containing_protein_putative/Pfam:PF00888/Pfam:PF10557 [Leishmania donovani]